MKLNLKIVTVFCAKIPLQLHYMKFIDEGFERSNEIRLFGIRISYLQVYHHINYQVKNREPMAWNKKEFPLIQTVVIKK